MIVNTRYGKRFAYNLAALADVVEALDNLAVQQVLGQDLNLGKICVQVPNVDKNLDSINFD